MEKTIILNRNGVGSARSDWYMTTYKTERDAIEAIRDRIKIAERNNDGWDSELVLCSEIEARKILGEN